MVQQLYLAILTLEKCLHICAYTEIETTIPTVADSLKKEDRKIQTLLFAFLYVK